MTTTNSAEIDHDNDCPCCLDEVKVKIQAFLDIRVPISHNDDRLQVILYHNWVKPDTAYLVFGQLYRILDLFPPNLFTMWIRGDNETAKPQA